MVVCGAQHVLTGSMYQSTGYQTMYLQVRRGAKGQGEVILLHGGML